MNKKSVKDMNNLEKLHNSLSAKTVRSTIKSCIIFGLICQLVALTFFAVSITKQYISVATSTANQAKLSTTNGADAVGFSKSIMSVYNSLSEDERQKMGTEEYRSYFNEADIHAKGNYDDLFNILNRIRQYSDVFDVYIAMYDVENQRVIYMVDTDENIETRLYPGEWEPANRDGMLKLLDYDKNEPLYYIEYTKKYGLLCTVGAPILDDANRLCSFMQVDISIESILLAMLDFSLRLTVAFIIVTISLAWLQTKHIKKALIFPINQIAQASQDYVKDRHNNVSNTEHFSNLNIQTGDEIENLCLAMADMEIELSEYEKNLTKITAEKERIGTELTLATAIQASMLPHIFPPFPDRKEFDIFASMEPAREVGGDFYDFFLIDEDHLCTLIADVSGKGIPAALFMMISKTILQSCAMLGRSVADILAKTNEALCSNNQVEMFVTVWVGVLEISTGKMVAAKAGHEYPIIKHADGNFEMLKDRHGFVIGGMPETKYHEYTIDFKPGDKLFIYTDGITEATNADMKMFGNERLLTALNQSEDTSVKGLITNVRAAIGDFVKDAEQFDDLTMLCLEYNGNCL